MTETPPDTPSRRRILMMGGIVAAVIIALDQVSKAWILQTVMQPPRAIEVTPFFNLVLAWNRGVSFGMFNTESSYGAMILIGVAMVIIAALAAWLWTAEHRWSAVAIGLVIGGALGNVVDRLQYGAVVDFLDIHGFGYHWPAFNVADAAICVGAGMLILESLFAGREKS